MLDIADDSMVVHTGNLTAITALLKTGLNAPAGYWNGATGIVSSIAAATATRLTSVGSRPGGSTFHGTSTITTDVLVKYTYAGDATLDGKVDGSDYSRIDNGFITHATGLVQWRLQLRRHRRRVRLLADRQRLQPADDGVPGGGCCVQRARLDRIVGRVAVVAVRRKPEEEVVDGDAAGRRVGLKLGLAICDTGPRPVPAPCFPRR